jgi:hypothetical protein
MPELFDKNNRFSFVPKLSIRPDKIVWYQEVIKRKLGLPDDIQENILSQKSTKIATTPSAVKQPEHNTHNFQLSAKAATRIKEKVTWLYELARNKTIVTSSGKIINSFKMNFITLTLPAKQRHSTAEITANCLNQFLIEMKKSVNLENFVWRLEYQKNGNVHYHIATDCFIEFEYCRAVWNRCIGKLGYVEDYHNIFSKLSFQEYNARVNSDGSTDIKIVSERYAVGKRSAWRMPNTVDCRAVANAKNIAFYISKYITKREPMKISEETTARDSACSNMRLWFCSRSLSKLDKISFYIEECYELAERAIAAMTEFKTMIFDYCKCFYFSTKNQSNECKALFWRLFNDYALSVGYVPAT